MRLNFLQAPLETDAEYIPPTAEQPAGQPTSTPAPTDNYLSYIPLEGNEQKLFYKKEQAPPTNDCPLWRKSDVLLRG